MRDTARSSVWVAAIAILLALSGHPWAQPPEAAAAGNPFFAGSAVAIEESDDELLKLVKARFNEALAEMAAHHKHMEMGRGMLPEDAGLRLLRAGLELYEKPEMRAAFLEQYVDFAKSCEKQTDARVQIGAAGMEEAYRARYFRLDAEIELLRARREAGAPAGQ